MNGPFSPTSHRYHHHHHHHHNKPKRCLPIQPCRSLSSSCPLLFHPSTKGSQIIMDMSQRTVKRQASFCNAITFSNRPIAVYEQVRLKVTKTCGLRPSSCVNSSKTELQPRVLHTFEGDTRLNFAPVNIRTFYSLFPVFFFCFFFSNSVF